MTREDAIIAALGALAGATGLWGWVKTRAANNYRWMLRKLGWSNERIDRGVARAKAARKRAKAAAAAARKAATR